MSQGIKPMVGGDPFSTLCRVFTQFSSSSSSNRVKKMRTQGPIRLQVVKIPNLTNKTEGSNKHVA